MTTCSLDLRENIKEILGERDSDALYAFLTDKARARVERGYESNIATSQYKVTAEYLKKMQISEERAEIAIKLDLLKHQKEIDLIFSFKKKGQGLMAQGYGIESNIKNGRRSIVADHTYNQNRYLKLLVTYLEEEGGEELRNYFLDRRNETNLAKEAHGEKTGDVMAEKAVRAYKKTMEVRLKEAAKEGSFIDEDENYISKTSHNSSRIKSATGSFLGDMNLKRQLLLKHGKDFEKARDEYKDVAYQRWLKTFKESIHPDTLKDVPIDKEGEFFRSFHDAVTNPLNLHKAPYDLEITDVHGAYFGLANRLNQKRVFIPKDAESWLKYNREYGYGTFRASVQRSLLNAGTDITVLRRLGVMPRATAKFLTDEVSKVSRMEDKIDHKLWKYKCLMNTLLGDTDNVPMSMAGRILKSNIVFQYVVKTGGIFLTELNDLGIGAYAMKQLGVSSVKFYGTYFKYLLKGLPKGEQKSILMSINGFAQGNLGAFLTDFGAIDSPIGSWFKFATLNEKLSGINRHDSAMKAATAELVSKRMADVTSGEWSGLDKELKRTFEVSGIDEKFFNLLKENRDLSKVWENTKCITPNMIDRISDESITKHFGEVSDMERFREELKDTLGAYISDQIGYAKILPTLGDRALAGMGIKKNSAWGQVMNSFLMFKNFHVASFRRTAIRFLYSNGAQSLPEALISGSTWSKYLKYVGYTLPFGYVSYSAHLLANGENLPDLSNIETWQNILTRSNATFLMGSMFADVYNSQRGIVDSLAGPVIKTADDVVQLLKTISEGNNPSKQLFWLIENNLPMIHLWYAKALIQHMFTNDILNNIDPMSGTEREQHAEEHGQSYWWSPTDNAGIF